MAGVDAMGLARAERADLADFLANLTPEQWNAPTLCEGWCVREVAAHVYGYEDVGFTGSSHGPGGTSSRPGSPPCSAAGSH